MQTYGAILCAGLGSRMLPFTEVLPKPLLPFLNTPLVTYALHHLASASIQRLGCNLCHLADTIPPVVDPLAALFGLSAVYAREWERLGTAGGVRGIFEALGEPKDALLVVLNGDSVMNLDLNDVLAHHRASGARATWVVRPRAPEQPGSVFLDQAQAQIARVRHHQARHEPEARAHEQDFVGVHVIETSLIAERLELKQGDIITELYGPMLEAGERINAYVTRDFWAALDTPELLMDATRRCLDDPGLFAQNPAAAIAQNGLAIAHDGRIDDAAQFRAPVFLGAEVAVAAHAKLGPYAVLDGVTLAAHTEVSHAVLYGMGPVEGTWRDCLAICGKVKAIAAHHDE